MAVDADIVGISPRLVVAFTSVHAAHGWLGNMSPHPLAVEWSARSLSGTWRTAEALFQAARFDDPEVREEIRACRSPMQTKAVAKREARRMVVEQRGDLDIEQMRQVLRFKVQQHPDIRRGLLEIHPDAFIVEDVTARGVSPSNVFWGAALINGEWVGENRLGRLWMDIRREIAAERGRNDPALETAEMVFDDTAPRKDRDDDAQ